MSKTFINANFRSIVMRVWSRKIEAEKNKNKNG
jgi:hypothetical protein